MFSYSYYTVVAAKFDFLGEHFYCFLCEIQRNDDWVPPLLDYYSSYSIEDFICF